MSEATVPLYTTVCGTCNDRIRNPLDGFCHTCDTFTGTSHFVDVHNRPITFERWLELREDLHYRILAESVPNAADGWGIRTCWTGQIDTWGSDLPFGTGVFRSGKVVGELTMWRDLAAALHGHTRIVSWMRLHPGIPPTRDTLAEVLP